MTDNEKRAHDIALAYLPIGYDNAVKKVLATGNAEEGIDIYTLYKTTYDIALKQVCRDFKE